MSKRTIGTALARQVICGDAEGWQTIHDAECGTWRWGTEHEIVSRGPDGKLWRFYYRTQPEEGLRLDFDVEAWEVFPHVVKATEYKSTPQKVETYHVAHFSEGSIDSVTMLWNREEAEGFRDGLGAGGNAYGAGSSWGFILEDWPAVKADPEWLAEEFYNESDRRKAQVYYDKHCKGEAE